MGGSSLLWLGSSICFHLCLQFLTWAECHNTASSDWNFFAGFRITAGTLFFVPEIKIAETRQLDLFIMPESIPDLVEECLNHFLSFTLVQSNFLKQSLSHI